MDMPRRRNSISEYLFSKSNTPLTLPKGGDPCTLLCDCESEEIPMKPTRDEQYIKKMRIISMDEEGRQNRIDMLQQQIQQYFEILRKY